MHGAHDFPVITVDASMVVCAVAIGVLMVGHSWGQGPDARGPCRGLGGRGWPRIPNSIVRQVLLRTPP